MRALHRSAVLWFIWKILARAFEGPDSLSAHTAPLPGTPHSPTFLNNYTVGDCGHTAISSLVFLSLQRTAPPPATTGTSPEKKIACLNEGFFADPTSSITASKRAARALVVPDVPQKPFQSPRSVRRLGAVGSASIRSFPSRIGSPFMCSLMPEFSSALCRWWWGRWWSSCDR